MKIEQDYTLETALQYFPDDFQLYVFPFNMDSINDLKWYSDFKDLMEYRRNPTYGNTKCFNCLLSQYREEAAIFLGINKVISRASEREYNDNISPPKTTIYPCSILNSFECPYKKKDKVNGKEDEKQTLMLMISSNYQRLRSG